MAWKACAVVPGLGSLAQLSKPGRHLALVPRAHGQSLLSIKSWEFCATEARVRVTLRSSATYVEALTPYVGKEPALFLAGGITDCPDWQGVAVELVRQAGIDWVILNPRRRRWPLDAEEAVAEQVAWESRHLRLARAVLFWFPASTSVQPIALYELGWCAASAKPLAVGAEPGYPRRRDVILQLSLARAEVSVRRTLAGVVADLARRCG
jgi:Nucleoside 2-deoxyribosyltransferase like